jgi:hypothetical protein
MTIIHTVTGVDAVVIGIEDLRGNPVSTPAGRFICTSYVVENVAVAEPEGRCTGREVEPVVGGHGDGDGGVLSAVAVRVTDEGCLPVSVELALFYGVRN